MKYALSILSLLLFFGCGGGGQNTAPLGQEGTKMDLFSGSTQATSTLPNATQIYLSLKYLSHSYAPLLKIASNTPKDALIAFNNISSSSPIVTKRIMCENGGWKEQRIEQINYDTKNIVASISYHQCHQSSLIHGTKKIEYSLDSQDKLSQYTESYPSDFTIDNIRFVTGSQVMFDHFHYTDATLDKYTALSTLKLIINSSSESYTLGFEDFRVVYRLSDNAVSFQLKQGKLYIKDASRYFIVQHDQDTDASSFSITKNQHLLSGKVSFEGKDSNKIMILTEREDLLSFSMENAEQTHLGW